LFLTKRFSTPILESNAQVARLGIVLIDPIDHDAGRLTLFEVEKGSESGIGGSRHAENGSREVTDRSFEWAEHLDSRPANSERIGQLDNRPDFGAFPRGQSEKGELEGVPPRFPNSKREYFLLAQGLPRESSETDGSGAPGVLCPQTDHPNRDGLARRSSDHRKVFGPRRQG
jgi:hypothetical protein